VPKGVRKVVTHVLKYVSFSCLVGGVIYHTESNEFRLSR
jgi:hypothetical protein